LFLGRVVVARRLQRTERGRQGKGDVSKGTLKAEMRAFVLEWLRSMAEKDIEAARRLRAADYRITIGRNEVLDSGQELARLAAPEHFFDSVELKEMKAAATGTERADVSALVAISGTFGGVAVQTQMRYTFRCRRDVGRWVAEQAEAQAVEEPPKRAPARQRLRHLAGPALRTFRSLRRAAAFRSTFQTTAYLPYAPRKDYVLPPHAAPARADEALAVPPEELWLGYDYLAHGEAHVRTMLEIAAASGYAPRPGDRILDLGCGSGRMIRHLRPLADACEIWGADISAPHIAWCRQHLSPPFHFVTTTKVPHLPFEDRSFAFIYCGSLFTHIDDMADAWLLELHRVLRPDGRLYLTIHDEETMRLFENREYSHAAIVREISATATYKAARNRDFGMFTIGRDDQSQIFYKRSYFQRMADNAFNTLSVTTEAYHYQSAFLLARKDRPDQ
jgi:ubiquinone/menaquinone biosynthesis C-methylase UbiE